MNYAFLENWTDFLPTDPGHLLCFAGSGGKTSLMRAVADFYRASDVLVTLTCTTRSEPVADVPAMSWDELAASVKLPPVVFIHDGLDDAGKYRGLDPDRADALVERLPDRIVLCEVDGAANLPLKLYRKGEPCWPAGASLALVVMGAGAVGGFASANVHRLDRSLVTPESLAALPGHTVLEWSHLETLLFGEGGYLDQVPAGVPAVLALAGMDQVDDSVGLFGFAGRAMEHERLPLLVYTGLGPEGPSLRTAYRCADESAEPS